MNRIQRPWIRITRPCPGPTSVDHQYVIGIIICNGDTNTVFELWMYV